MVCGLDDEYRTSIMLGSIVFRTLKNEESFYPVEFQQLYMCVMNVLRVFY